jgi:rubredoxin
MPSETFYCPHCKNELTKTPKAYVLGAAYENDSMFMLDLPPDVICPDCGKPIDSMKMIKGDFDLHPVSQEYLWVYVVGFFGSPFLLKFIAGWSWVPSILAGFVGGLLAAQIIIEIIKLFNGKKK